MFESTYVVIRAPSNIKRIGPYCTNNSCSIEAQLAPKVRKQQCNDQFEASFPLDFARHPYVIHLLVAVG